MLILAQGRVAHAEAGADVFGDQLNGGAISYGVGLSQVFHGFDQQTLPIDVPGVGSTFASSASNVGSNRDREDLGHENPNVRAVKISVLCPVEVALHSITPSLRFFSFYLPGTSLDTLKLTLR